MNEVEDVDVQRYAKRLTGVPEFHLQLTLPMVSEFLVHVHTCTHARVTVSGIASPSGCSRGEATRIRESHH